MQPDLLTPPPAESDPLEGIRPRLVDCAAEVFFRCGFKRGTTKQIADLAGVSQSLVSHYFKKSALMGEIARRVSCDFTKSLDEALAGDYDAEEQLARILRSFMESMEVNRKPFAVYWKEFRSIPEAEAKQAQALEKEYVARVARVVALNQKQGTLPPGHDPRLLTEGILGMLSWTHRWYQPGLHTPQRVASAFRDLIGCGPAARRPLENTGHNSVPYCEGSPVQQVAQGALPEAHHVTSSLVSTVENTFDPPELQLAEIIRSFIYSMDVNQKPFAVYWKELRSIPAGSAEAARARERAYIARVVGVVETAQDQRVLPSQHSPFLLAKGILGMLSWTQWWYKRKRYQFTPDQVVAAFCSLVRLPDCQVAQSKRSLISELQEPQRQAPTGFQNDPTRLVEWVDSSYRPVHPAVTDVVATVKDLVSPESSRRWYPDMIVSEWRGRRRSILDNASEVFFLQGYEAGTTKEIADREGVVQPAISKYFKKHEMMAEIAQRVSIEFTRALDEAIGSVRRQLLHLVYVLAASWDPGEAGQAREFTQIGTQDKVLLTRMRGIAAAAQEEGILPSHHDPRSLVEGILATIRYLHSTDYKDDHTPEEIAAAAWSLLQLDAHPADEGRRNADDPGRR